MTSEKPAQHAIRKGLTDPFRVPLAVLLVGLLSIALLLASDRIRHRSVVRDHARVKSVQEIQRDAAISHLWLEEHVSGDVVEVGEVSARLERSLRAVDAMLEADLRGKSSIGSQPTSAELNGAELAQQAVLLGQHISELQRLSRLRLEGLEPGLPVGVGSALDVEYDAMFASVLQSAQSLEAVFAERLARNRARARWQFSGILIGWGVLIVVAAMGLWTRERHRRLAETALIERDAQLHQAQKLEAVGRVAGGLAHDINNYLAAIRGHCELVRRKLPAEDRVAKKMDAVVRIVGKSSALIERLLAFSQRQPSQPEVVQLNRVVASLVKMLRPSLGERIQVRQRLADGLWNVEVDVAQIEQVIVNLMINARDAMPDGGEILFETSNVDPVVGSGPHAKPEVMLAVSDTGIGIPAAALDKIFDPFWTTKDKSSHSGLGLATVYGIVQQSGGRIQAISELGSGTKFTVWLPYSKASLEEEVDEPELRDTELTGSESVLFVDDNRDVRMATKATLEALGYRVTLAADGEQAAALFGRSQAFDLVLTDVVMPGMSGIELVAQLRREGDVRAIFMSGYGDAVTRKHGLVEGKDLLIKKPFSSAQLARLIRETLD